MLLHSRTPRILDSVTKDHPLHGRDLRTIPDVHLAEGAARAILPEFEELAARLIVGQETSSLSEPHREVWELLSSCLRRASRILVQYVQITRILPGSGAGPPTIEVSDEVLDAVTLAYVHMVGIFDAIAIVNGLQAGMSSYPKMGWQKASFRKEVRPHAPDAVKLMDPQAVGGTVLRAVSTFRNTIHKRMPDPTTFGRAGGDPALREMRLHLERRSHGDILDAFRDVGWTKYVGVREIGDDLFLRPESALGLMLNDSVPVLNQLLDATPVEAPEVILDPRRSLYPPQLRGYALEYFRLRHLVSQP